MFPRFLRCTLALSAFALVGCMTQRAYDGPALPPDEVAHISGDLRFNAGVPVVALLRQVDRRTLSVAQSGVDVQPGEHQLLVDCVVQESSTTRRFVLDVEVHAGRRYRLVPETGPGLRECTAVNLEEDGAG